MKFSIFLNILSIFILLISIGVFLFSKRWSIREIKRIEKKKEEILEVLSLSDQMIGELNKFSDYIVNQIEEKYQEVENMLIELDNKIHNRKELIKGIKFDKEKEENHTKSVTEFLNKGNDYKQREKVFDFKPFYNNVYQNSKSLQIISLAEEGFEETEIARKLNVGRGEVQLILGMKNGTTNN